MAGKKYGLEDKYKMMYGGMTNSPVRANLGLFIKAGVGGAKKIAQSLAKSKDINVGSTLNKARDVSKYDTSTLTDKGAFVRRAKELALPKKSTVKEAVKKTLKNPVVKYGSAATAGYEAKEIVDDMKKPEGKRKGGSAIKKAALVGAGLLASNYLGKRAGEADASRIALGIDKPETTSAFGVNINPTRFKAKGGMHKANTGKLIGNQHKLDINKDGKISKEDFKMLKSKKKK
jgi:hypothetical protein